MVLCSFVSPNAYNSCNINIEAYNEIVIEKLGPKRLKRSDIKSKQEPLSHVTDVTTLERTYPLSTSIRIWNIDIASMYLRK